MEGNGETKRLPQVELWNRPLNRLERSVRSVDMSLILGCIGSEFKAVACFRNIPALPLRDNGLPVPWLVGHWHSWSLPRRPPISMACERGVSRVSSLNEGKRESLTWVIFVFLSCCLLAILCLPSASLSSSVSTCPNDDRRLQRVQHSSLIGPCRVQFFTGEVKNGKCTAHTSVWIM